MAYRYVLQQNVSVWCSSAECWTGSLDQLDQVLDLGSSAQTRADAPATAVAIRPAAYLQIAPVLPLVTHQPAPLRRRRTV